MEGMDEIVSEFLVESQENLDQLDQDLVALEREPGSRELLSSIFRTVHTIKGTCGFLDFGTLESVTHVSESLLSRLRDGEMTLTPQLTTVLLEMVDAVRSLLASIEQSGSEGNDDYSELVGRLNAVLTGARGEAAVDTTSHDDQAGTLGMPTAPEGEAEPRLGEVLVERGLSMDHLTLALAAQELGDRRPLGQILVDDGVATSNEITEALRAQGLARRSAADGSVRVDVDLLDALMNLVGELILTRIELLELAMTRQDSELQRTADRLNMISGELEEGVMRTRMQPIDSVWGKLPRLVRDLCVTLGKSVRVETAGSHTEVDKTILEAVKDPLTHLVRNCVDHGVEQPAIRVAAGKPAQGRLMLRAFHAGGQVNIEISDDGAGIDPVGLRTKAVSLGMLTREAADQLGDREALRLIFHPGFTTATAVTNVSGRGVGMDVVRTNIEKIGGAVDVASVVGQGTTVRIKIPVTLANIPGPLVVR